jgi:hypothetical protein
LLVRESRVGRAIVVVAEVPGADHPKRSDNRQRARFGSPKRVFAVTRIVDELPLSTAGKIDMADEDLSWILLARVAIAPPTSFVVVARIISPPRVKHLPPPTDFRTLHL